MKAWTLLLVAVACELTATMALRASVDQPAWLPLVVAGYVASFVLLALTLRAGLAIGVAYGSWGALGVASTAVLGWLLFDEALSGTTLVGIALVIVGVVVVENGSRPTSESTS